MNSSRWLWSCRAFAWMIELLDYSLRKGRFGWMYSVLRTVDITVDVWLMGGTVGFHVQGRNFVSRSLRMPIRTCIFHTLPLLLCLSLTAVTSPTARPSCLLLILALDTLKHHDGTGECYASSTPHRYQNQNLPTIATTTIIVAVEIPTAAMAYPGPPSPHVDFCA